MVRSAKSQREWLSAYVANNGSAQEATRLVSAAWFDDVDRERDAYITREMLAQCDVNGALTQWQIEQARLKARGKDAILDELAIIGMADPGNAYDEKGNLLPVKRMPPEVRRAVKRVKQDGSIEFHDKNAALQLLGKNQKLFTDSVEINGTLSLESLLEDAKVIELERAEVRRLTTGSTPAGVGATEAGEGAEGDGAKRQSEHQ